MAKVNASSLRNIDDGGTVTETDWEQVQSILITAINATDDEVKANKTTTDGHKTAAVLDHPDSSVITSKLADSSVTNPKLANKSVSMEKVDDTIKYHLDNAGPGLANNSQTFTATEGQTVFTLTNGTYEPGYKRLVVKVGGSLQQLGEGFTETSITSFTLSEGVPAGTIVYAQWYEGSLRASEAHATSHKKGALDELKVDELGNYQELVYNPLSELANDLYAIPIIDYGTTGAQISPPPNGRGSSNIAFGKTFTYPPILILTLRGISGASKSLIASSGNLTATGATIYLDNIHASASGSAYVDWVAVGI